MLKVISHWVGRTAFADVLADGCSSANSDRQYVIIFFLQGCTFVILRNAAMNVFRMIKLFGWEPRSTEQLSRKREEELLYQKKYKLLNLAVFMAR